MKLLQKHNTETNEKFDGLLEISQIGVEFKQVVIPDTDLDGGKVLADDSSLITGGEFNHNIDFQLETANCFAGTLTGIGCLASKANWALANGHMVAITALADGCFHIEHNATMVDEDTHRGIDTRLGRDLKYIRKALFTWSADSGKYVLLSFEKIRTWTKRFVFTETQIIADPYEFDIPIGGINGLPYNGFYHLDAYFEIQNMLEITELAVSTTVAMGLKTKGEQEVAWTNIDTSDSLSHNLISGNVDLWTKSMQGSKIVEVDEALCADRLINMRVEFNNGDWHNIAGYVDVIFLGTDTEGHYCCIDPV